MTQGLELLMRDIVRAGNANRELWIFMVGNIVVMGLFRAGKALMRLAERGRSE